MDERPYLLCDNQPAEKSHLYLHSICIANPGRNIIGCGEGSCTLNHGSELKVQHPHTPVRPGGGCKTSATFHLHSPFASSEFVVELLAMQCLCLR